MLHAYVGILSKLRSLNLLSEPFDEQQFFVPDDDFESANNTTGDLEIEKKSILVRQRKRLFCMCMSLECLIWINLIYK